ncbi:MAG: DUF4091 domain-containing protein [Armatimonadetes bacterium]|nr:DUF4091 domain-containing protein [Armatimonadota bacterium]
MPTLTAVLVVVLVLLCSLAVAADYTLWTAPSVQKVFRADKPPDPPAPVHLTAAHNEFEAVQVVITAGDEPLKEANVTAYVGRGPGGGRRLVVGPPVALDIPVRLYLPHYVPCPNAGRDFPDPLPPLTGPFDVAANTSQPVWVELYVPPKVGRRECAVEVFVKPANAPERHVRIDLTLRPFALPADVQPVFTVGLSEGLTTYQHEVKADAPEAKALMTRYYEFLLEHYASPYYLPVDLKAPEAAKYLNDPRLTSYIIPWKEDEAYLRDIATYLEQHGWLDKGYMYVVDEPINQGSYDQIKAAAALIHRAHPNLRLTAPFYRAPDWNDKLTTFDVLTGSLDIWCPNEHYFDTNPRIYEQFRERQQAGETGWWYVCCGPGEPYNNFFVSMDGFSHRLIFTQMYRMGVTGLLYWNATYWNPSSTKDPWTDIATVKDINPLIYGDGSLLYPGKQVGIDGPVGSIRLKLIRDGIEDYQYLRLLAEKRGEEAAKRAARTLCKSLSEYCHDANQLARVRDKIAAEIADER